MKIQLLAIILLFSACRQSAPATASVTSTEKEEQQQPASDKSIVRLEVAFYSTSSGIDYPAMIAFEDSIGAYSSRIGKNIDYRKKGWGREGETEFCLTLKELTEAQQKEFVEYTRKWLKNAKWVNVNENAPCRH